LMLQNGLQRIDLIGLSMNRYWVSWWSGNYVEEGCTEPPFMYWVSGQRDRGDTEETERDECSICAVVDSESKDSVWELIAIHFPDYEERFCTLKPNDYVPGNRFPKE